MLVMVGLIFLIYYTQPCLSCSPECGGDFLNVITGTVKSPNYPNDYPHNCDCIWRICGPAGYRINISLIDGKLGKTDACRTDYAVIRDGFTESGPELKKLCYVIEPETLNTTGRYAYVQFHSNAYGTFKGFNLSFTAFTDPSYVIPAATPFSGRHFNILRTHMSDTEYDVIEAANTIVECGLICVRTPGCQGANFMSEKGITTCRTFHDTGRVSYNQNATLITPAPVPCW